MPAYVEFQSSQSDLFPPASQTGNFVFGVSASSQAILVDSNGNTTVIGTGGGGGNSLSASNGVVISGSYIQLGGSLTEFATYIDNTGKYFIIASTGSVPGNAAFELIPGVSGSSDPLVDIGILNFDGTSCVVGITNNNFAVGINDNDTIIATTSSITFQTLRSDFEIQDTFISMSVNNQNASIIITTSSIQLPSLLSPDANNIYVLGIDNSGSLYNNQLNEIYNIYYTSSGSYNYGYSSEISTGVNLTPNYPVVEVIFETSITSGSSNISGSSVIYQWTADRLIRQQTGYNTNISPDIVYSNLDRNDSNVIWDTGSYQVYKAQSLNKFGLWVNDSGSYINIIDPRINFTTNSDVIAAITGSTYNSGNGYAPTLSPANSKVFYQGQLYSNPPYLYVAISDNRAFRISGS